MECLFKYLDSLPGDFGISLSHNKAGVYLYRYLQVGGGRHVGVAGITSSLACISGCKTKRFFEKKCFVVLTEHVFCVLAKTRFETLGWAQIIVSIICHFCNCLSLDISCALEHTQ